ncbi:MAG: PIN domain-containing protein [Lentisphaerae bacterium]|jgi:predicted nucleic acid-binding protein|nr:PIN domain-containing protein [Lentisphaerota bacterium]
MHSDYPVVLDACVLANGRLCDLYLRLAETPRLYTPIWSSKILAEVHRTQTTKLKRPYPKKLADYWRQEVDRAFPEACAEGWEPLLKSMTNDPKDRHVLAVAVKAKSNMIVTFNLRDFPPKSIKPWQVEVLHPQDHLLTLWSMNPAVVMAKLARCPTTSPLNCLTSSFAWAKACCGSPPRFWKPWVFPGHKMYFASRPFASRFGSCRLFPGQGAGTPKKRLVFASFFRHNSGVPNVRGRPCSSVLVRVAVSLQKPPENTKNCPFSPISDLHLPIFAVLIALSTISGPFFAIFTHFLPVVGSCPLPDPFTFYLPPSTRREGAHPRPLRRHRRLAMLST